MFGFVAAAMERLPVVGLIFSISNRMYVHSFKTHSFNSYSFHTSVVQPCGPTASLRSSPVSPSLNPSGADLEKQQHAYASGAIARTKEYHSKTAALPASDLPSEFVGGFPTKKGPVRVERDGSEVGLPPSVVASGASRGDL